MRKSKKIFIGILLAALVVFTLTACGNGSTNMSTGNGGGQASTATTTTSVIVGETAPTQPPSPTTAQQGSGGVSGIWNGQWANETPDNATGTFSWQLSQQGSTLTGNISIVGTPCLSGGSVTGSVNGTSINFGVIEGEVTVNYAGTISGDTMSGYYSTSCGKAFGNWQATKQ